MSTISNVGIAKLSYYDFKIKNNNKEIKGCFSNSNIFDVFFEDLYNNKEEKALSSFMVTYKNQQSSINKDKIKVLRNSVKNNKVKRQSPKAEPQVQQPKVSKPTIVSANTTNNKATTSAPSQNEYKPSENEIKQALKWLDNLPEEEKLKVLDLQDEQANNSIEEMNFNDFAGITAPYKQEDWLIVTAYYLRKYKGLNNFTLKDINSMVFNYNKKTIDHSIIKNCLSTNLIELLIQADSSTNKYRLTLKGEEYYLKYFNIIS